MGTRHDLNKQARITRLRQLVELLRANAGEGHMPYVVDALEQILAILETQ
jgi:hypothetical protein